MMGSPNAESNDSQLQYAFDRASEFPGSFGKPYLIPPRRRRYAVEPGDMDSVLARNKDLPPEQHYIPEWLPLVQCTAKFTYPETVRDESKDLSCLTVVWYQDDFGLDDAATEDLRKINWAAHACDIRF
jgi:hypothetical protein